MSDTGLLTMRVMTLDSDSMKKLLLFILFFTTLLLFSGEYKRVVSLTPSVTEMICAVGAEELLVARSDACDYPQRVKQLPVAGKLGVPDVETILRLKADLIISDMSVPAAEWDMLKKLNIKTVLLVSDSLASYRRNILTVGALLGKKKNAWKECERFYAELETLRKTQNGTGKVSALILLGVNPLVSCSKETFVSEIVELAGTVSITRDAKQRYFVLSSEFAVEKNPEIAVISGMSGDFRKHISSIPVWKHLRFVRNQAMIDSIPQELLCRLSPRTPQAVRMLREAMDKLRK